MTTVLVLEHAASHPELRELPNTGDDLRAIVGGYFDYCQFDVAGRTYDAWVNDEGLLDGLPLNRTLGQHRLHGPIVISKANARGEQVSLDEEDVCRLKAYLEQPRVLDYTLSFVSEREQEPGTYGLVTIAQSYDLESLKRGARATNAAWIIYQGSQVVAATQSALDKLAQSGLIIAHVIEPE